MSLLDELDGPLPVVGEVYELHPDLYDSTDAVGHPVMVISVDDVRQRAEVATRTTKLRAKGPNGVPHGADLGLKLNRPGWWRIDYPKSVPYANFEESEDAAYVGAVDDATYNRLVRMMGLRDAARTGRALPRSNDGEGGQ